MAMEDAVVLARALKQVGDIGPALLAYEKVRKERTAWAQLQSRAAGDMFHAETITAETFAGDRTMQMNTLFGYDAQAAEIA